MRDYSNQDNDMTAAEERLYDLEGAGYWKSKYSGKWYEKVHQKTLSDYKPGELRLYNWVAVDDEKAVECLEAGMVPSFRAVEEMSHD